MKTTTSLTTKGTKCTKYIGMLLGTLMITPAFSWAEAGYTSANFLKIGTGARAAAMADSFTAVADDSTALYWNPAGLALLNGTGISTTHGQWLQGVTQDHLALTHKLVNEGGFGLGLTLQNTQAFNASLEDANGNYSGTGGAVTASDWALSLAYGDLLGRFIQGDLFSHTYAGLKVNLLGQNALTMDGTAVSFEMGLLHSIPEKHLLLGLALQNIGTSLLDHSQPVLFKVGASWFNPNTFTVGDRLTFALDADIHDDTGFRPSLGTEYKTPFSSDLSGALRAGIRTTDDLSGFSAMTFGAGLEKKFGDLNAGIDYAFVPYGVLGATHRFTLNVSLPGNGVQAAALPSAVTVPPPGASAPVPSEPSKVPTVKPKEMAVPETSKIAPPAKGRPVALSTLESAQKALQEGRLEEALKGFQEAAAKDPNDRKIQQLLGNCLVKMGRMDEAQKVFQKSPISH